MALHEADRQSIEMIYEALNGENWENPWTLDNDLCDEVGITCQRGFTGQFVLRLNLSDPHIEGDLAVFDEIPGLRDLQDLYIIGCEMLTSSLPASLNILDALNTLHIINSPITGPLQSDMFGFENLQFLRYLVIDNTYISGPIPDSIGESVRLIRLNMANNNFSGPLPDGMGSLVALEYVDLRNNFLSGTGHASACALVFFSFSGL